MRFPEDGLRSFIMRHIFFMIIAVFAGSDWVHGHVLERFRATFQVKFDFLKTLELIIRRIVARAQRGLKKREEWLFRLSLAGVEDLHSLWRWVTSNKNWWIWLLDEKLILIETNENLDADNSKGHFGSCPLTTSSPRLRLTQNNIYDLLLRLFAGPPMTIAPRTGTRRTWWRLVIAQSFISLSFGWDFGPSGSENRWILGMIERAQNGTFEHIFHSLSEGCLLRLRLCGRTWMPRRKNMSFRAFQDDCEGRRALERARITNWNRERKPHEPKLVVLSSRLQRAMKWQPRTRPINLGVRESGRAEGTSEGARMLTWCVTLWLNLLSLSCQFNFINWNPFPLHLRRVQERPSKGDKSHRCAVTLLTLRTGARRSSVLNEKSAWIMQKKDFSSFNWQTLARRNFCLSNWKCKEEFHFH